MEELVASSLDVLALADGVNAYSCFVCIGVDIDKLLSEKMIILEEDGLSSKVIVTNKVKTVCKNSCVVVDVADDVASVIGVLKNSNLTESSKLMFGRVVVAVNVISGITPDDRKEAGSVLICEDDVLVIGDDVQKVRVAVNSVLHVNKDDGSDRAIYY